MSSNVDVAQARRTAAAVSGSALVVVTAGAVLGVSLWPLVVVAAATWWTALGPRVGRLTALGLVGPGALVLLLGTLVVTGATGLPAFGTVVAVWLAVGVGGCTAVARSPATPRPSEPGPDLASLWVPALLGPVVWASAVLTGASSGSVARLSWTMMGDSVTNLLYARSIVDTGGVPLGDGQNPVPLPSALIALSTWAGRGDTPGADLLRHDLTGFVVVWSLLVAATCFTAGLAAAVTIGPHHPRLAAASGALASVLPLTWFVSGYALEFGFFNAHVVLPVLLLCWVVVIGGTRSDAAVLLALMLATTVMLAAWTPLTLVPAALGAVIVMRRRRQLVATRTWRIALGLGAVQAGACAALVALPALRSSGGELDADGSVYPLSRWVVMGTVVIAIAVTTAAARRRDPVAAHVAALMVACTVGVGALLLVNLGQASVWNYYPLKLAWLSCVIAIVVLLAVTVRLVASAGRTTVAGLVGGALVLALTIVLPLTPRALGDRPTSNPVQWVVNGTPFEDDAQVGEVLRGADPDRPQIRWSDGADNEDNVNFWILQMLTPYPTDDDPLYRLSYSYRAGDLSDLCEITRLVRPPLTIRTDDATLTERLGRVCPGFVGRVVVNRPA